MSNGEINIDAFMPPQMANRAEAIGIKKAHLDFWTMFSLAILAGAFVGAGAVFFTTTTTGAADKLAYGVTRMLGGLAFCLGLILVIVAGAELFTGNNLIVMAWANRKVGTRLLLRNWGIVYAGNFVGAMATAILVFYSQQYTFGGDSVGANALSIANAKVNLGFTQALVLGILCNALVCMAVWLCYSARSTTDKILAIIFPVTAFVAAGFEHSIANMYFVPMGLFIKAGAPPEFWAKIGKTAADYGNLTWDRFLINNLLPVTIGNIIGGAGLVGLAYWFAYLRTQND